MKYTIIKDYYRLAQFDFFKKYRDPRYHCTIEFDITLLKQLVKKKNYSLYYSLCYIFTKVMIGLPDFRYRLLNNEIVQYEKLHPRMLVAAKDGTFSEAAVNYKDSLSEFDFIAKEIAKSAEEKPGILEADQHKNQVYYSSTPKVSFTSLTHISENDSNNVIPKICFGKFHEKHGKIFIPAGIQVNHIFIDGNHLGLLAEKVQYIFNNLERL